MDNSYYTGATLIRAGTTNSNGGGSKYGHSASPPSSSPPSCHLPSTNLAGPPLLMQPNLLTGLPLIRNGQAAGAGPGSQAQCGGHPQPPPGLICCFQPVYYIPASNQSAIYSAPSLVVNGNNSKLTHNHNYHNNNTGNGKSHQAPKRKNYKNVTGSSQMKGKPSKNPPLHLTPEPLNQYYHHPKLSASASFPDPISPPAKQPTYVHNQITRTMSSSHFFATSMESNKSQLLQNEEKQRNDKLLNFYFYDKHWRPRDETDEFENSESCQKDNDRSWDFVNHKSTSVSLDQDYQQPSSSSSNTSTPTFDKQPGAGRNQFSPSPQTILKQQKDLEVEAQIITLANGHRDLEIRLCYVTS